MICNNCQKEITGDGKYCPHCGGTLLEQSPICANCGASLEADSKFCPRCGIRMRESTVTYQQKTVSQPNPQVSEYTGRKTVGAYWVSVIGAIVSLIIRLSTQAMQYSYENIFNNRKLLGIDSDAKPFYTIVPVAAAIIVSLLIVSDQETPSSKKGTAFIINAVFIALAILFIWFDIPYSIIDF